MATTTVYSSDTQVRLRNNVTLRSDSSDASNDGSKSSPTGRKWPSLKPIHFARDSLLSSSSGYTNYRGFVNLCFIILVLSNVRVALENIIKYGILVDPFRWVVFFSIPNLGPMMSLLLCLNFFILGSFQMERILVQKPIKPSSLAAIITIYLLILLALPPLVFSRIQFNPIAASISCTFYSVIFLKLISYHMVNHWCRQQRTNGQAASANNNPVECKPSLDTYPNNLTLSSIYYFIFAPTLCYELNYPRTDRIRKRFVIKRILEILVFLQLDIGLIQQWVVPTIRNSLEPFMEMSGSRMLERLLKLAVPNHLIWLIFFYFFFHSFLNVIAELMRFADREFYNDWWNSTSVEYFWKNWNIPVHRWCVRHIYVPLLSFGFSNFSASMVVFLVSAFFHEYLVSVPLNMYRIWAFTGMIMQLPFAYLVRRLNQNLANYAVWLSLIIGQPLCILMYYHDFYVIHIASQSVVSSL